MLPAEVTERYRRWWPAETLPQRLASIVDTHADRIALIDGARAVTFGEAARLIDGVAATLAARGVRPGDTVSWVLANRWEAAIVHQAALRAGAVGNPLLPGLGERDVRAALQIARPAALVTQAAWRGADLGGMVRALSAELGVPAVLDVDEAIAGSGTPPPIPADPAAPALLLFTSGTTSEPKGVEHSHRGLLCEVDSFTEIHALTAEDRYLCGPPVAHIAGLAYGILAPFALGTSTVFLRRWVPGRALEAIARDRATFMTGPPTFLQTMAEHGSVATTDTASFRLYSTGGASIHEPALRVGAAALGCVVKRAYGSTEVPTLTAGRLGDAEALRLSADGRLIGGSELRIDGAEVAPDVEGEIWARAPEMFIGYRGRADEREPGGWFRTGDLGTVDVEGNLRVTGRLKDVIIRGGENISALEVEELLVAHPAVAEAAVIGLPDARLGERACACVVLRDGASLSFDAMVAHLRTAGLATHKLPERLEALPSLPRTDSGKVRKADLVAQLS